MYSNTVLLHCKWRASENPINVWFPFMYSHKWNCYFQNRIIMFCLPVPTLIYLWEIFLFPRYVCLFCCRKICGPILGINKSLTDIWKWKLGLRPRNSQKRNTLMVFSLQCSWIRGARLIFNYHRSSLSSELWEGKMPSGRRQLHTPLVGKLAPESF